MKTLSRPFTVAMAAVFAMLPPDIAVVAEHSARHIFSAGDEVVAPLEAEIEAYQELGYALIKTDSVVAFMSRGNDNIELIPPSGTEHEALAVATEEHLKLLKEAIVATEEFTQINFSDPKSTDVIWYLYHHKATGVVIQIIWRKEQLFSNIEFVV